MIRVNFYDVINILVDGEEAYLMGICVSVVCFLLLIGDFMYPY